ncbi:UNVERIFIED_CONTAM: hypothetical protein GTU68_014497 [Idotea baltica]|nr:hypothetical protein [Idotea baltica]
MENYLWPIIGGVLIGLSAILLMLSIGKIAGISGIMWGAFEKTTSKGDRSWRFFFLLGIVLGAFLLHSITGKPIPIVTNTPIQAILAGLLVGVGVKLGNGCTSGHGVCGISRLSTRSIVATITFMFTAILTVALS